MIVDDVGSVSIYGESEGAYRIEYLGFIAGWLSVTQEGVEEMSEIMFQEQSEIPNWVIGRDCTNPPGWLQEQYDPPDPIQCAKCGNEVSVSRIVTPLQESERYCPDCWNQIRDGQ
jgi:hypothetical protein